MKLRYAVGSFLVGVKFVFLAAVEHYKEAIKHQRAQTILWRAYLLAEEAQHLGEIESTIPVDDLTDIIGDLEPIETVEQFQA